MANWHPYPYAAMMGSRSRAEQPGFIANIPNAGWGGGGGGNQIAYPVPNRGFDGGYRVPVGGHFTNPGFDTSPPSGGYRVPVGGGRFTRPGFDTSPPGSMRPPGYPGNYPLRVDPREGFGRTLPGGFGPGGQDFRTAPGTPGYVTPGGYPGAYPATDPFLDWIRQQYGQYYGQQPGAGPIRAY